MCLRVRAHLCGGALALMPLGLEGAIEIVAAPLVSSHAYALQQHSTLVGVLEMHACRERQQGGKTAWSHQSCKQRAQQLCTDMQLHQMQHLHRGCAKSMSRPAHAGLQQRCRWLGGSSML